MRILPINIPTGDRKPYLARTTPLRVRSVSAAQVRPRALRRLMWNSDAKIRHAIRWYYCMDRQVWILEIIGFFFRDRDGDKGETLVPFLATPQDAEKEASRVAQRARRPSSLHRNISPRSGRQRIDKAGAL